MKFVKALNSGIVTDLGMGGHVYKITTEGTEVEDHIAGKLSEIFGQNIEVSDIGGDVENTSDTSAQISAEVESVSTETVVEEIPAEVVSTEETKPEDLLEEHLSADTDGEEGTIEQA